MRAWQWAGLHLLHQTGRSLVAAAGVAFAVILLFMQLGFRGGVDRTATLLFDQLQFDLIIVSSEYEDLSRTAAFPRLRLAQALAAKGVTDVIPVSMGFAEWRMPRRDGWWQSHPGGNLMSIAVLATPPERLAEVFVIGPEGVFDSPEQARAAGARLRPRGTFLFDRLSKPEYGTAAYWREQSHAARPVDPVRVNGQAARVTGEFRLGTGFSWNAMLLTGEPTFYDFIPRATDTVNFGLVHVSPATNISTVQQMLRAMLPSDVQVLRREEITAIESRYWVQLTSVGQFLTVGVAIAVVIGVIFVYQMMAADVRAMLPEFATIKALGHGPRYAAAMVLWQGVFLTLAGFMPGWLAACGLFRIARHWGGIPAYMTIHIVSIVFFLTLVICLLAGMLTLRKVHTADPADLF